MWEHSAQSSPRSASMPRAFASEAFPPRQWQRHVLVSQETGSESVLWRVRVRHGRTARMSEVERSSVTGHGSIEICDEHTWSKLSNYERRAIIKWLRSDARFMPDTMSRRTPI